jgi:hypothetical protein
MDSDMPRRRRRRFDFDGLGSKERKLSLSRYVAIRLSDFK